MGAHFYPSLGTGLSIVDEIMHFWPPSHILMLVVLINNISICVILCSLCFNSKCVYVWNALAGSMSGPEMSIYGQMVADETWAPISRHGTCMTNFIAATFVKIWNTFNPALRNHNSMHA